MPSGEGSFEGKSGTVSKSIDLQTGSMRVEIDLDNSKGKLLPGMFGEATIHLEKIENALVLPAQSVRFDESGTSAQVYVIEGDKVKVTAVKTGIDDGAQIQILEGLTGSEQVAAGLIGRLSEGTSVKVIPAENGGK